MATLSVGNLLLSLSVDDLLVSSFETSDPLPIGTDTPYSPYCCTEGMSGCDTNLKAGCTDPRAGCWVTEQPTGDAA
jgi:hypothetical protein